ncbi:hypothetical protein HY642_02525 [Candidatus Woesearchaeota archaeon]|nr:hypothetical protein [Candidatus Woesearchaeota archaeon]
MPQWTEYRWVLRKLLVRSGDGADSLRLLVRDAKPLRALKEDDKKLLERLVQEELAYDDTIPADEKSWYESAYKEILQRVQSREPLGTREIALGKKELQTGMGSARALTSFPIRNEYFPKPLISLFLIAMYHYEKQNNNPALNPQTSEGYK